MCQCHSKFLCRFIQFLCRFIQRKVNVLIIALSRPLSEFKICKKKAKKQEIARLKINNSLDANAERGK